VDLQPVIDQHAAGDDNGGIDDPKVQPRRRQALEVGGVGEEREHLFARPGQPQIAFKMHTRSL
jgi:hypothetical protein